MSVMSWCGDDDFSVGDMLIPGKVEQCDVSWENYIISVVIRLGFLVFLSFPIYSRYSRIYQPLFARSVGFSRCVAQAAQVLAVRHGVPMTSEQRLQHG